MTCYLCHKPLNKSRHQERIAHSKCLKELEKELKDIKKESRERFDKKTKLV